ncbi:hypothetical protein WJ968_35445 [Achromobacter xylosoxidans]
MTATGTPCSGPRSWPCAISLSAWRAARQRAVLHEQCVALEPTAKLGDAFELAFGDGFRGKLASLDGQADFAHAHVVQIIVIHPVLPVRAVGAPAP